MKLAAKPADPGPALTLLSVVIPARNEEESLPATVEHLHLELRLNHIPHEIVVVDDGSSDRTWQVLQEFQKSSQNCAPSRTRASMVLAAPSCSACAVPRATPW